MQAECVFPAFDNQTSIHYVPGLVPDFDETNEKLNALTIPGSNRYVFRYPGHELALPKPVTQESPAKAAEASPEAKVDKRRKTMTAEQKQAMKDRFAAARASRKAKLEAAAA